MSQRCSYDAAFKLNAVEKSIELGSNRKAAEYFKVNERQIRLWKKVSEELRNLKKDRRRLPGGGNTVVYKTLDDNLVAWLRSKRAKGEVVTGKELQVRALELSEFTEFKASSGWLVKFKARHGLTTRYVNSAGRRLAKDEPSDEDTADTQHSTCAVMTDRCNGDTTAITEVNGDDTNTVAEKMSQPISDCGDIVQTDSQDLGTNHDDDGFIAVELMETDASDGANTVVLGDPMVMIDSSHGVESDLSQSMSQSTSVSALDQPLSEHDDTAMLVNQADESDDLTEADEQRLLGDMTDDMGIAITQVTSIATLTAPLEMQPGQPPSDVIMADVTTEAAETVPVETTEIVIVNVPVEPAEIVPVGVPFEATSIVPVGMPVEATDIVPVSVPVEAAEIVPVGVPVEATEIVPVGVPFGATKIVPVEATEIVPVGVPVEAAEIVPVGVPVEVTKIVPVGVPVEATEIVPVGVPVESTEIVPVGVPVEATEIVPVGVPIEATKIVPVGVPVEATEIVPVGVPVEATEIVPVGVPVEATEIVPVGVPVEATEIVPVGVPVGVPVEATEIVPVEATEIVPVGVSVEATEIMPVEATEIVPDDAATFVVQDTLPIEATEANEGNDAENVPMEATESVPSEAPGLVIGQVVSGTIEDNGDIQTLVESEAVTSSVQDMAATVPEGTDRKMKEEKMDMGIETIGTISETTIGSVEQLDSSRVQTRSAAVVDSSISNTVDILGVTSIVTPTRTAMVTISGTANTISVAPTASATATPPSVVNSPKTSPLSPTEKKTVSPQVAQTCIICRKTGKCKYNIVRNGDVKHLCNDACFKVFRANPSSYLQPSAPAVTATSTITKSTPPKIAAKPTTTTKTTQSKKATGVRCMFCKMNMTAVMVGRFTLPPRDGAGEARQFCQRRCRTEFQSNQKFCALCKKELKSTSVKSQTDTGQKEFCNRACQQRYADKNPENKDSDEVEIVGTSRVTAGPQRTPAGPQRTPAGPPSRTRSRLNTACAVCKKMGQNIHEVVFAGQTSRLCSDTCFSAFRQSNKLSMSNCDQCGTACCNEGPVGSANSIQFEGRLKRFCNATCLELFKSQRQRVVSCAWCNLRKSNFDMIERVDADNRCQLFCTLNCLSLYRVNLQATSNQSVSCDRCRQFAPAQYHLTMSDASVRNFCSYACVMSFQGQFTPGQNKPDAGPKAGSTPQTDQQPASGQQQQQQQRAQTANTRTANTPPTTNKTRQLTRVAQQKSTGSGSVPVISSVMSLANYQNTSPGNENTAPTPVAKPVAPPPPPPKQVKNKSLLCKPFVQSKATSCRVVMKSAQAQTDENWKPDPIIVPIPIPIYIPVPMAMYAQPVPYPLPMPVPIPVPCFIPTTKKSASGILKTLKEIQERTPADPFEAEMLAMAEAVATEGKDSEDDESSDDDDNNDKLDDVASDSEKDKMVVDDANDFAEDMLQMALRLASEMPTDDSAAIDDAATATTDGGGLVVPAVIDTPAATTTSNNKRRASSITKSSKRLKQEASPTAAVPPTPDPDAPSPDANMVLKYMFGVNAWRQWITEKNSIKQEESPGLKVKRYKTDVLQCTVEELNFLLCMFISEVRKANGDMYSPDSIYYLCLGIQQYLFENNRIDNIFTDTYFESFTEKLNDLLLMYEVRLNVQGLIVCRIEEEHLWECKQLGAHSPHVLLNTLVYFNTRFFYLRDAGQHLALSFSHIMKHWKKTNQAAAAGKIAGRSVYLRYYAPATGGGGDAGSKRRKDDVPIYEQGENTDNPLRCPVKLYEFYLSKCPESIKNRNDVFYLVPERSCVPDSPVWYSTNSLGVAPMNKMLNRVRLVREIQEMQFGD